MNIIEQKLVSRETQQRLFATCFGFTRDKEAAEDLTQDVLLKAWENRDKYKEEGKFYGWLGLIARHCYINQYRRKKKRALLFEAYDFQFDCRNDGEYSFECQEIREQFERLPEKYQNALGMYCFEGKQYEEIAEATKTKLGTVKSRIFHGRKALAERLKSRNYTSP